MPNTISRRGAIGSLGAGLLIAAGGAADAQAEPNSKEKKSPVATKIDTHQHFLPKVYIDAVGLDALAAMMPNRVAPSWSPEAAIAMMDGQGIAKGMLSISSGPAIPNAAVLLRKCNDEAKELAGRFPGRFGSFASLPLPDIDASLKEIEYSFDTLHTHGVVVFTNYGGKYLGDASFAPVFAELNRRKAVVFIHPNEPNYQLTGMPPSSVLEFPFETTRTATSLILSGSLKLYPDIRFILSHAGGTLPYLSQRLEGAIMMNPAFMEKAGPAAAAIKLFWFDTALSAGPASFAALFKVADPKRILFGTDFPMAPLFAISSFSAAIDRGQMEDAQRAAIFKGNAEALLGASQKT